MSLWADYLSECLGKIVLEAEEGFAVYLYTMWNDRKAVYIEEIYVRPDLRKRGVAASLADAIADVAKEQGCAFLIGSVAPTARGSTASLKVLLSYGFELSHLDAQNNLIIFTKRLDK